MKKKRVKRTNRKVVKIKRSTKYSDRIIITFENKSVLRVPEDAFILHPINVGDIIPIEDIRKYDEKMRLQEARDSAYKFLSYRMRSVGEIKKKLIEKSFLSHEIDSTIDHLKKLNYLNDLEFAHAYAREKVKFKMIGPLMLRSELYKHHIDTSIIDEVVQQIYDKHDVYHLIEKHIEKKSVTKNKLLEITDKKKLDSYLSRKGFSWGKINEVYIDWGLI